jgi:hypothetical protein
MYVVRYRVRAAGREHSDVARPLYHSYQVYGATTYHLHSLAAGVEYDFAVDAANQNGTATMVSAASSVVKSTTSSPRASSLPVLELTVINCTGPETDGFLKPLVARVDPSTGRVQDRVSSLASGEVNLSSVDSNFAVARFGTAVAEGSDQPPGYPEGIRTVLATVDMLNPSAGKVVAKHPILPKNVTDPKWNPLSASWLLSVGPSKILARHRTLEVPMGNTRTKLIDLGGRRRSLDVHRRGEGLRRVRDQPVIDNEWMEVIDTAQDGSAPVWRSEVVFNNTRSFGQDEPMPAAYFGDVYALDYGRNIFYSQRCACFLSVCCLSVLDSTSYLHAS